MNEDAFNMSLRKFLKKVGVTAQREIEQAVREAAGSSRPAGLVRQPCSRSLPTSMRSKARVSLPFGGNGPRAQMFRYPIVARLTICETGSAKNAPSAASAAVRSG